MAACGARAAGGNAGDWVPPEWGVMLHDVGEEIEHVYFPHTGMVSLVAVMQSRASSERKPCLRRMCGCCQGLGSLFPLVINQAGCWQARITSDHFAASLRI